MLKNEWCEVVEIVLADTILLSNVFGIALLGGGLIGWIVGCRTLAGSLQASEGCNCGTHAGMELRQ